MDERPDFRGNMKGYLAYAEREGLMKNHPQWCARHWAPAPVEGRNGLMASMLILQYQIEAIPVAVRQEGAGAMNQWVAAHSDTPLCCLLGDEKIEAIWAETPAPNAESMNGESDG